MPKKQRFEEQQWNSEDNLSTKGIILQIYLQARVYLITLINFSRQTHLDCSCAFFFMFLGMEFSTSFSICLSKASIKCLLFSMTNINKSLHSLNNCMFFFCQNQIRWQISNGTADILYHSLLTCLGVSLTHSLISLTSSQEAVNSRGNLLS